jgi:hypothetical protein
MLMHHVSMCRFTQKRSLTHGRLRKVAVLAAESKKSRNDRVSGDRSFLLRLLAHDFANFFRKFFDQRIRLFRGINEFGDFEVLFVNSTFGL